MIDDEDGDDVAFGGVRERLAGRVIGNIARTISKDEHVQQNVAQHVAPSNTGGDDENGFFDFLGGIWDGIVGGDD